jgi:hypothetical protein
LVSPLFGVVLLLVLAGVSGAIILAFIIFPCNDERGDDRGGGLR